MLYPHGFLIFRQRETGAGIVWS